MRLDKLMAHGAFQCFTQWHWRNVTCLCNLGVKHRIRTELFYTDRANSQTLASNCSDEIKSLADHQTNRVGQSKANLFRFAQYAMHRAYQLVHGEVRLVDIVIDMHTGLKGNSKFQEGCDIFNISHRLAIFTFAYHDKATGSYLSEQVVHVASILLPEHHCRSDNDQGSIRWVFLLPFFENQLGCIFGSTIIVKRRN